MTSLIAERIGLGMHELVAEAGPRLLAIAALKLGVRDIGLRLEDDVLCWRALLGRRGVERASFE